MELLVSNSLAIAGIFIFALLYTSRRGRKSNSNSKPPVVPGAWPVIGHLRQLTSGKEPLVRTLGALADKYGPIFTVRIGMQPSVVISSWETARDCFSTNDKLLADRPPSCAGRYLGYDYAVLPFSLHCPYWRRMRKLVVVELLSNNTLEKLKPVWMSELEANIKELYTLVLDDDDVNFRRPIKVDMSEWFGHLTLNLIVKLIGGRRYKYRPKDGAEEAEEEARCMTKVFKEIMCLVGEFAPGDAFFPTGLVRWLDFGGQIASMKRVSKAMDDILQNWIKDHVRRREIKGADGDDDRDFIDVMLSVIDDKFQSGDHSYTRDTIIKAASLSMLEDAADTLGLNLEWVLSLLLNNPHVMKKVQEEIDSIVGKERWVEDCDVDNMAYLQAAVKEAMRLYPPAPLLVPHRAMEECIVGGYTLPKGTILYANAWKIQRDPQVWPEPEKFLPERFLAGQTEMDTPSRHFGFIPFGIGRRSCPGISYALKVTHLSIGRLLQGFNVTTPLNMPVDMSEGQATTLPRATPLEVLVTPRLPSSFYGEM
ncbi:PREDICTED: cytochrome P450 82C4-like [Ipomoea nil]|uniref:cytochrome P450 82C4-like n=1 Tax=Ipomoea nil TaxID=35883 RepID=UPI000900FB9A|nr:PREDICTED: cytochrome P450 82C4-like [Ipomoea nil]